MKVKICLTMIVRNEQKIIERCLDSVKDIIDCVCICDTGSNDDTVSAIEKYLKKNNIPGKVFRHEWKNFGHNRSLSVEAAQQLLPELGFTLEDTFLLLLDADMLLKTSHNFSKDALDADSYQLVQVNNALSYYNTRLVRASLPWKCVGVTHEHWSCITPCREAKLHTLHIDDRDDGGCKSDKFERDVRLLTQGLKDEPTNARYMFYLARSYDCLRQYKEAIKWYQARINMGGWFEEVWYSKYMLGLCHEHLNQWDRALGYYLDAYQFNPDRAETIHHIARYYRLKEQYNLAYAFAKMGANIPYPSQQVLFISHPVYDYLFDEEISISAYYTPFKEEGYAAANRLILKNSVPQAIKDQAYKNMLFYVQNLKNAQYQSITRDQPAIQGKFLVSCSDLKAAPQKMNENHNLVFHDFPRFLGCAVPVKIDNGQLLLVRENAYEGREQNKGWHRFAFLDQNSAITKVSKPFIFLNKDTENCCAMTTEHTANKLVMAIGLEKKEAYLCSIDIDAVRAMLEPLCQHS